MYIKCNTDFLITSQQFISVIIRIVETDTCVYFLFNIINRAELKGERRGGRFGTPSKQKETPRIFVSHLIL